MQLGEVRRSHCQLAYQAGSQQWNALVAEHPREKQVGGPLDSDVVEIDRLVEELATVGDALLYGRGRLLQLDRIGSRDQRGVTLRHRNHRLKCRIQLVGRVDFIIEAAGVEVLLTPVTEAGNSSGETPSLCSQASLRSPTSSCNTLSWLSPSS